MSSVILRKIESIYRITIIAICQHLCLIMRKYSSSPRPSNSNSSISNQCISNTTKIPATTTITISLIIKTIHIQASSSTIVIAVTTTIIRIAITQIAMLTIITAITIIIKTIITMLMQTTTATTIAVIITITTVTEKSIVITAAITRLTDYLLVDISPWIS